MLHIHHSTQDVKVHSLASGSSGNAMLVQAGDTNLLIDAGLSLKVLSSHLTRLSVPSTSLSAILLTHEHTDHSISAGSMSRRNKAPLIANAATLNAYQQREELPFETLELPTGSETLVGRIGIRSFPVPHDAVETVGYILQAGNVRIVYCTDVGSVTPEVRASLEGVNLAIVESNHGLDRLMRGPYTEEMKARVASPHGHLSNEDCGDLIAERLEEGGAMTVWLAHLSRVNNSPALARRSVMGRISARTNVPVKLEVALRDHPSLTWKSGTQAFQQSLF